MDKDKLMDEAERLSVLLANQNVDLGEAERAGDYYCRKGYSNDALLKYLGAMAQNPPPRSKQSQRHYQSILGLWNTLLRLQGLEGEERAFVWGWAVRLAKARQSRED